MFIQTFEYLNILVLVFKKTAIDNWYMKIKCYNDRELVEIHHEI